MGLSDHTIGSLAAVLALGQGAVALEKHFILDQKMMGQIALFQSNLKNLVKWPVKSIRHIWL